MTFGDSRTKNINPVRKLLEVLLIRLVVTCCSRYKQSPYLSKYVIPVDKSMIGCNNKK